MPYTKRHGDIREEQELRTSVHVHSLHVANAHYIKCICTYIMALSICMSTILNHFDVGISNNVAEMTRNYYLVCPTILHSNW